MCLLIRPEYVIVCFALPQSRSLEPASKARIILNIVRSQNRYTAQGSALTSASCSTKLTKAFLERRLLCLTTTPCSAKMSASCCCESYRIKLETSFIIFQLGIEEFKYFGFVPALVVQCLRLWDEWCYGCGN